VRAKNQPPSALKVLLSGEASSGVLLVVAAAVALAWASSPWGATYEQVFGTPIGVRLGGFTFARDLRFWLDDGLMAVFFFTVGLEIKRELRGGQLGTVRRAALPALAALGGMVVPAAIYVALNAGTSAGGGWGIPMATDIAFAVGMLALLGKRVSPALRITLLALAVLDDLGAVAVIAVFFSSGIGVTGLAVAAAGLASIFALQRLRVRSPWAYVPSALITWAGAYAAGVHPTLAGVALGLMTPVRARGPGHEPAEPAATIERVERTLHPVVAFGIVPLFALANAGVALGGIDRDAGAGRVFAGVALGLALGKPIGVVAFSWLAVRLRAARLPAGTSWAGMLVLGLVAGTGFTMSLFMITLALDPGPATEMARLAVLAASAVAALAGLLVGRLVLPLPRQEIVRDSALETTR
jgi:NhaA family Na+:H+ antiporter